LKKILLVFGLAIIFFSAIVLGSLSFYSDGSAINNNGEMSNNNEDMSVVILTASGGAKGFGHTALLFERDNSWFYFSWQSTKVVFSQVPNYALDDFDSFNSWILEDDSIQNYIADFDSAILIRGDFSDSLDEAKSLYIDYLNEQDMDYDSLNVSLLDKNLDYNIFFIIAFMFQMTF
jgi:hypothetical protein